MPRTKDPVAELAAHRKKEAAFKDKAKLLEEQAAAHLGRKLMDRELHLVERKLIDDVLDRVSDLGADEALRRLSSARVSSDAASTAVGLNEVAKQEGEA
ncbi:hypothetical protein HK107_12175 [Parvularcula sp. ZS-1/3]|uniref:DUF64370 domain-containing protein n=1 Tax=Parvularcula mediterranea TaxID=2732508 RepID=A0A7Y3W5X7_9PROT|nr:DUF6437 family protein [Parvularcula mediterranea]NNU17079.1 hypothetical protein [Parvularcula mediterranea]